MNGAGRLGRAICKVKHGGTKPGDGGQWCMGMGGLGCLVPGFLGQAMKFPFTNCRQLNAGRAVRRGNWTSEPDPGGGRFRDAEGDISVRRRSGTNTACHQQPRPLPHRPKPLLVTEPNPRKGLNSSPSQTNPQSSPDKIARPKKGLAQRNPGSEDRLAASVPGLRPAYAAAAWHPVPGCLARLV